MTQPRRVAAVRSASYFHSMFSLCMCVWVYLFLCVFYPGCVLVCICYSVNKCVCVCVCLVLPCAIVVFLHDSPISFEVRGVDKLLCTGWFMYTIIPSMANRVAHEMSCGVGDIIGYHVRYDSKLSPNTLLKFMTDGILMKEVQVGLSCNSSPPRSSMTTRSFPLPVFLGALFVCVPAEFVSV